MEEDKMPKKIFTQLLEGTRRRERPRKGWKEEVERDLPSAGSEKMEKLNYYTNYCTYIKFIKFTH